MSRENRIDLGRASLSTKGGTGVNLDEYNGVIPLGLSDE